MRLKVSLRPSDENSELIDLIRSLENTCSSCKVEIFAIPENHQYRSPPPYLEFSSDGRRTARCGDDVVQSLRELAAGREI